MLIWHLGAYNRSEDPQVILVNTSLTEAQRLVLINALAEVAVGITDSGPLNYALTGRVDTLSERLPAFITMCKNNLGIRKSELARDHLISHLALTIPGAAIESSAKMILTIEALGELGGKKAIDTLFYIMERTTATSLISKALAALEKIAGDDIYTSLFRLQTRYSLTGYADAQETTGKIIANFAGGRISYESPKAFWAQFERALVADDFGHLGSPWRTYTRWRIKRSILRNNVTDTGTMTKLAMDRMGLDNKIQNHRSRRILTALQRMPRKDRIIQ